MPLKYPHGSIPSQQVIINYILLNNLQIYFVLYILLGILDNLQQMSESFKYVVTVVMLQRTNTGFHLFSTCFWDQSSDGTVTVQWENKSMHCVVTVYGIAV
jgi:hypothetical protein